MKHVASATDANKGIDRSLSAALPKCTSLHHTHESVHPLVVQKGGQMHVIV